jgi:hypothetical protein
MDPDPIGKEVRRIRDEQARKFNDDIQAMCEDAIARQRNTLMPEEIDAIIRAKPSLESTSPLAAHENSTTDYKPQ